MSWVRNLVGGGGGGGERKEEEEEEEENSVQLKHCEDSRHWLVVTLVFP